MIDWLDPFGLVLGLNGVIRLAYTGALPANEIVIPTVVMLTVPATGLAGVGEGAGGWTLPLAMGLVVCFLVAQIWRMTT